METLRPRTPTPLPIDFWRQPDFERAARQRHFGYLLRAYRELQNPPVKQVELASWLGITQGQLSRIERGINTGHDLRKLAKWANAIFIPQDILWFDCNISDTASLDLGASCTDELHSGAESEGDDLHRRDLLKTAGLGAVLLGSEVDLRDSRWQTTNASRAIGHSDIDSLRHWASSFRQADNRYGGGESFDQVRYFVSTRVVPTLQESRCTTRVRRDLLSVAGELYQLTGWMAYDVGDSTIGRKCLRQSFRLCEEAGNSKLAAEILAGMSHQAAFLHSANEAVDLALAARQLAIKSGPAALVAEAAVMEAHGLVSRDSVFFTLC